MMRHIFPRGVRIWWCERQADKFFKQETKWIKTYYWSKVCEARMTRLKYEAWIARLNGDRMCVRYYFDRI